MQHSSKNEKYLNTFDIIYSGDVMKTQTIENKSPVNNGLKKIFDLKVPILAGTLLLSTSAGVNVANANQKKESVQEIKTVQAVQSQKPSYSEIIKEIEKKIKEEEIAKKREEIAKKREEIAKKDTPFVEYYKFQEKDKTVYKPIYFEKMTVKSLREFLNEDQNKALDEILASILTGENGTKLIQGAGKDIKEYIESRDFAFLKKFMSEKEKQDFDRLTKTLTNEQVESIGDYLFIKAIVGRALAVIAGAAGAAVVVTIVGEVVLTTVKEFIKRKKSKSSV
jgi:hypothetical protein